MGKEIKELLVELIEVLLYSDTAEGEHCDGSDHSHGTFCRVDRDVLEALSEKISNL
jgi:hypothetical protein